MDDARRVPNRGERVEQLRDHVTVLQVVHDEAARMEHSAVRALRYATLGDRDQTLHERPKLLRLRHGRRQVLVAEQGCRLVPQHRDPVLGDASQFSMCDSVSH